MQHNFIGVDRPDLENKSYLAIQIARHIAKTQTLESTFKKAMELGSKNYPTFWDIVQFNGETR